jgi:hypothetical protein
MSVGDQWIEAMADAVASRLKRDFLNDDDRILKLEEAAEFLGMAPSTLLQRDDIPRLADNNRRARYSLGDLRRWSRKQPRMTL